MPAPVLHLGATITCMHAGPATPLTPFPRVLLLEAGADVNAKTASGRTPLSMAEKARADETSGVISLWILKGCKPKQGCGIGTTRAVKKLVK